MVAAGVTYAFDRATKRLGYDIRWHDLRHSHATQLLARGVHPKVVQERLGHANVATLLRIYAHSLPGIQAAAVDAVQAMYGSGE